MQLCQDAWNIVCDYLPECEITRIKDGFFDVDDIESLYYDEEFSEEKDDYVTIDYSPEYLVINYRTLTMVTKRISNIQFINCFNGDCQQYLMKVGQSLKEPMKGLAKEGSAKILYCYACMEHLKKPFTYDNEDYYDSYEEYDEACNYKLGDTTYENFFIMTCKGSRCRNDNNMTDYHKPYVHCISCNDIPTEKEVFDLFL